MGLLNIAGLGSSLPVNAYAVLNLVNGRSYGQGGLPEISGVLSSLSSLTAGAYSANHVYTPTDASWASQELVSNANSIAGEQGTAQAAYTDLQAHAAALQALRDHLTASSSPKDVQDAQAQIELEAGVDRQRGRPAHGHQRCLCRATGRASATRQRENEPRHRGVHCLRAGRRATRIGRET